MRENHTWSSPANEQDLPSAQDPGGDWRPGLRRRTVRGRLNVLCDRARVLFWEKHVSDVPNKAEQDSDVLITARLSESRCEASDGARELREIPLALLHLRPLLSEAHQSVERRGKVNCAVVFVGGFAMFWGEGCCWL